MNAIMKYDVACRAIAEAASFDEVQDIADKAIALQEYARRSKNREMETQCAEIRIRAERRLGELLAQTPKATGGDAQRTRFQKGTESPPTLAESGIDKKLSSRAQKLAKVAPDEFERQLAEWRQRIGNENERVIAKLTHVSHNSGENEWYTPADIIERARHVMGSIDTDPASCEAANALVKATVYFDVDSNGLTQTWNGNVWLNPPYAQPLISQFATAISTKFSTCEFSQACILVNNATETEWFQTLAERASMICFPSSRIKFIDKAGNPSGAPLQGQAIIYLGIRQTEFKDTFMDMGLLVSIYG